MAGVFAKNSELKPRIGRSRPTYGTYVELSSLLDKFRKGRQTMSQLETIHAAEKSGLLLAVTEQKAVHTGSKQSTGAFGWWDDGDGWDSWWDADGWDGDGWDGWDGDY
jgi:hypothetical protein